MLVIGLDEAGYGPLLGPLVVAGAAFRLPVSADDSSDSPVPDQLRAALAGAAHHVRSGDGGRGPKPRGRRPAPLRVGDSKRLMGASHDLRGLELPVLAFASVAGRLDPVGPADLPALMGQVGAAPAAAEGRPWYSEGGVSFPLRATHADIAHSAEHLGTALAGRGAQFVGFAADVLHEERLNASFAATGNKADTLFDVTAGVLERLLARRVDDDEEVVVVLDRHGGRRFYGPPIQRRWPGTFAWTLREDRARSTYRIAPGGPLGPRTTLTFAVKADDTEPQVALASMLAKYLREVHMALWNAWFAVLCPDVRPTAGYVQDARRWLEDTRALREAAGIPDERLVRTR